MERQRFLHLAAVLISVLAGPMLLSAGDANQPSVEKKTPTWAVVYDFTSPDKGKSGARIADSVRLKLRRHDDFKVIDRLTTQEFSSPTPADANRATVADRTLNKLGANFAVYGTVARRGGMARVTAVLLDLRHKQPAATVKVFSDDSERWRAVIVKQLTEAVTGRAEWQPPEYGDEPEPKADQLGKPLNRNGSFDKGHLGWDRPDGVSTFIVDGPKGRGKVLRVRTDLKRDPWLTYRKRLRKGLADPNNPPTIGRDTSYGCVGGLEGVHYRSEWIEATPGRRYWMLADCKGRGGAKVFLKGFGAVPAPNKVDGLPESSLAELGLAPRDFAELPSKKRRELIAADVKKKPMRHVREVYRWYLNCGDSKGEWMHFAAPVPPRGGLPGNVKWLQIQVYSYWPAGEYLWDDVFLYEDPRQKGKLPEEPARTEDHSK
jgi:TolB-like protein